METLLGLGALWFAAAAAVTVVVTHGAAHDEPFRLEADRLLPR